jgi:hypothetical protein
MDFTRKAEDLKGKRTDHTAFTTDFITSFSKLTPTLIAALELLVRPALSAIVCCRRLFLPSFFLFDQVFSSS